MFSIAATAGFGERRDNLRHRRLGHFLQDPLEGDTSSCDLRARQERRQAGRHRCKRQGDSHRRDQVRQLSHGGYLPGHDDVRDPVQRTGDETRRLRQVLVLALHLRPVLVQRGQRLALSAREQLLDVLVGRVRVVVRVVPELP